MGAEKINSSLPNSVTDVQLPLNKHRLLFKIVLVVSILIILIILILFLSLINIINTSTIGNFFIQKKPNISPRNISAQDNCSAQGKQYLQLTVNNFMADGIAGGTYQGILQNVNYNQKTKSATLQISNIANGNDKTKYTFSVSDDTVRIHDNINNKFYTSLTQLVPGQHITLTYNCDPQNNTFTIVTINIEQ